MTPADGTSTANAPGLCAIFDTMTADGSALTQPLTDTWMQGRTTYGGLSAAMLLESVRRGHADLPPLRSALVNFTAPTSGEISFRSDVLRKGRNITTISADALADEAVLTRATFTFGNDIPDSPNNDLEAPKALAPEDSMSVFGPHNPFKPPAFLRNFDLRYIDGSAPGSGAKRGYLRCWVRHLAQSDQNGIVPLLALADVLPPAASIRRKGKFVNSSVTWICNFLRADAPTRDGWYQVEMDLSSDAGGYSSQVMRMWTTEGEQVVDGMQSVIVFPIA